MSSENSVSGTSQQQQPEQHTQELDSMAIAPYIEPTDDESLSEQQSTTTGELTPSCSDLEHLNEGVSNESRSSPPSVNREATSDSINEALGELSLAPNRSTSASPGLFDGATDQTDTPDRHASVSRALEGLQLLNLDGDQLSDDGTDEDDDRSSSLFDVQHEPLPQAPIYDEALQGVLKEVKGHLSSIEGDMKQSSLINDHGSDFFKQYEQVQTLSKLDCPETRTVGFIGNSGVGKSRLINSLLDLEGLARSSANGSACTSVVTEFRNIDAQHPNRTIEVNYMDSKEVEELLQGLLQSFRMYYTDAFREVTETAEQERIRERSTRAWGTFNSIFRNRPELTHEFLADQTEGAQPRILKQLQQWADLSCRQRPGGTTSQHTVVFDSFRQCRTYLDQLTMDPRGDEPAAWPFINIIRVYLASPILATGLVLADLPGFRDLNFARVRATEKYLKHVCNEVFVVTTISRCITDQSIDEIKSRCNEGQPMRIVCTRSEDIIAGEYARDYEDLAPQINMLERRVRQAQSRLARARRGSLRNHSYDNAFDLFENEYNARYDLNEFLIQTRNQRVTTKLREHGRDIRIFCVSNELYSMYRRMTMAHDEDYFNLSGIPELRRYCQLVPAEAQFCFVAALLEHRVPAVLRSAKQWALAGLDNVTAEKAQTLRHVLSNVELVFQKTLIQRTAEVQTFPKRLQQYFSEEVLGIAYEHLPKWEWDALEISRGWARFHHSTYAAFCRHEGAFKDRNWNTELLEGMQSALDTPWLGLKTWILMQRFQLERNVAAAFMKNLELLNDNVQLAPIALENFLDNMDVREACIMDSINQSFEHLTQKLIMIMRDALCGHSSSYMVGLMLPVYDECTSDGGRGVDARRKSYMRDHLTNSNIFSRHLRIMDTECHSVFKETHDQLKQVVNQEARDLCADTHVIVAEEGELTEATRFPETANTLRDKVDTAEGTLEKAHRIINRLRST